MRTIIFFFACLCFLLCSCADHQATHTVGRYKNIWTSRTRGPVKYSKRVIKDTVDHYTVRVIKTKENTRGAYSYVIRSKAITYNRRHKRIMKTIRVNRRQQQQRNRTIYYYKNHDNNTMKELEELENALSVKIVSN